MNCACQGKGLDIQLCDFHARVLNARTNRLMIAANDLFKKVNGVPSVKALFQPELDALIESLNENGVSQLDSASEVHKKKAHFLLRRAYDALLWCGGSADFQAPRGKAHKGWKKDVAPLLDEIRKVFKPAT